MRRGIVLVIVIAALVLGVGAATAAAYFVGGFMSPGDFNQSTNYLQPRGPNGPNGQNVAPGCPYYGSNGQNGNNNCPFYGGRNGNPGMMPGYPNMMPGYPGMMPGYRNRTPGNPNRMPWQNGQPNNAAPAPQSTPNASQPAGQGISMDAAVTAVQSYLSAANDSNLKLSEVMQFQQNFYAAVLEKDTGRGAMELLIDPSTGTVTPEIGPNMMWNTKYGHMGGQGGMMGGFNNPSGAPQVSLDQAKADAQKFLDANVSGAQVEPDGISFYGYYTFDYKVNGEIAGMLSVNDQTGDVWLHTWHGAFIAEKAIQ